jgi:hypothetical protein
MTQPTTVVTRSHTGSETNRNYCGLARNFQGTADFGCNRRVLGGGFWRVRVETGPALFGFLGGIADDLCNNVQIVISLDKTLSCCFGNRHRGCLWTLHANQKYATRSNLSRTVVDAPVRPKAKLVHLSLDSDQFLATIDGF